MKIEKGKEKMEDQQEGEVDLLWKDRVRERINIIKRDSLDSMISIYLDCSPIKGKLIGNL